MKKIYLIRRIQSSFMTRPPNFSWFTDNIAASGIPSGKKHLLWLKENGINTILCLLEYPLNREEAESMGFRYVNIPMEDHEKPELDKLFKAVEIIRETINNGGRILVHCAAGLGRTGTVLAAYLIIDKGVDVKSAVEHVRRLRPGSIEDSQVEALHELYNAIGAAL